jgi:heat shock protein HtpX
MKRFFTLSVNQETNIKSLLVLAGISTVVGALGSLVAGSIGLYLSIGFLFTTSALTMWYSRELALWAMKAEEVKPNEKPEGFDLTAMVDKLRKDKAIDLKVMPKVCIINSDIKNAFATGRHKGHTAIAVSTGLLKAAKEHAKGDQDKANRWIEAILCHELGHIANHDIATKTAASIMTGTINSMSEYLYFQKRDDKDQTLLGAVAAFFMFKLIVPFTSTLLGLALSRTREFAADDMAATCGRAKDMAEAFELLRTPTHGHAHGKDHKHEFAQMEAFSGMMCASLHPKEDQATANGLKEPNLGWGKWAGLKLSGMLSTHPALEDRIQRMKDYDKDTNAKRQHRHAH